jgi:predicted alpha/beta-fold hydrolase
MEPYRAPGWLPGPHAQTIAGSLWPQPRIAYERERWSTPDGDFIDVDWAGPEHAPRLIVVFHGVGGNSQECYVRALAAKALATYCWRVAVPHFRGCSGKPNDKPRSYFSGDHEEIDWLLERFARRSDNVYPVGISLGGNSLLKWLCERGAQAKQVIQRAAVVSAQYDLAASGAKLEQGFNRVYGWWLILKCDGLRRKALAKLDRFPDEHNRVGVQRYRVSAATTFPAFDDALVAPLHGFDKKTRYWAQCSTKAWLTQICVPTLLLHAENDPFYPVDALPAKEQLPECVSADFQTEGGHASFPGRRNWMARRVLDFLSRP